MKPVFLIRILFYTTIIAIFAITACKKESEPTKTELLSREWKTISIDGESVYDHLNADELTFKFDIDGMFKSTRIAGGFTYTVTGNWIWRNNEALIEVEIDSIQETFELNRLTKEEFWFISGSNEALFKCEPK